MQRTPRTRSSLGAACWVFAASSAALLLSAAPSYAQPAPPPPASEPEEEPPVEDLDAPIEEQPQPEPEAREVYPTPEPDHDEEPEPPLIPPARDTLGGHVALGASALVAFPFGSLERDSKQTQAMGKGYGFGADLGIGVSRTVVLGVWGQMLTLGEADECVDCSTKSLAGGAFIRYHLVQGVRFDPWMSAGLGYRTTNIDYGAADITYSGIEWLRLQVGGDWYAFDKVGFGPYMELDMGRYSSRSEGEIGDSANHWHFLIGARVVLDLPGK